MALSVSSSSAASTFLWPQAGQGAQAGAVRGTATPTSGGLTEEGQRVVQKLKARDAEVRAHEAAHLAAAGGIARGGASFSYENGPDGKSYATGGEVSIDTSPVSGDPQATLRKAEQIRRAALAPANPSGQDMGVAASAAQMLAQAQAELTRNKPEGKISAYTTDHEHTPGRFVNLAA